MRILLNGEPRDVPGPVSVRGLLASLDIDPRVVAVEVDRRVVPKARHDDILITEHAEVEIVSFVGGG